MEKFDGKENINARININYKGKKPKVSFSYPDKKNQERGSLMVEVGIIWFLLNMSLMLFVSFVYEVPNNTWFILYLFGGYALIYFPFKKFWDKFYPDVQAFTSRKKYKTFQPTEVKFHDRWFCELILFNNIVCDFNATEDFGKYLEEFEIREHDFVYKKRKGKEKNEGLWYARFYFKDKPANGKLEVVFK